MSACAGSCINGPKAARTMSVARRRSAVVQYAKPAAGLPREPSLDIAWSYAASPVARDEYSEMQLREALRTVGKHSDEDELNCGGCGYDSCRDFAHALIARNAERMMCATYTRKLAQKKANALLQKMPSAVVIVDEDLKIIECNTNFVHLFADDVEQSKDLEGAALDAVIPFSYLFRRVLESDEDIVGHDIRYQRSILNTSIFTIEPHSVMCGIFQDITKPIFQKEQIIGRAREVIQKNLKTVQQIAFLLGENAADSEIAEVWQSGYFNDRDRDFYLTFDLHMDAVMDAFKAGKQPPVHARAGRRALQLALAAIKSFETGKKVSVPTDSFESAAQPKILAPPPNP